MGFILDILFLKNSVHRFKATLYPCPEAPQEREEMLKGVNTRLYDLKTVSLVLPAEDSFN